MSLKQKPTLKSSKARVGITLGDPSGIGPQIILKALRKLKGLADFTVIGDRWVLDKVGGLKLGVHGFKLIDMRNVPHKNFSFGRIKAEYGRASIEYLDKAQELIKKKEIDCLVTCPVSKEAINLAGFKGFSGHTEYLARSCGVKDFVMLLLNKDLKLSLITRHVPLKEVSSRLNKEGIYRNVVLTQASLKRFFAILSPRIVVCGLNPHASDNGIIGSEENEILRPALRALRKKFKNIFGPYPADVAIAKTKAKEYDCAVAMYHDQALIPLKLMGDRTGVNMTLGLPFVRTSPLHGTAFDIAAKHKAYPDSLIEAIKLAAKCALNQKKV